ncbi:cytidine deaminase family protein [Psychromonas algicola]|uniref:cytidine deaminase family protein n=1 Tax=Psychromonas algicola TaxID=2555642 RepID=UPI001067D79E|nr:cytidine deaminase [Psychromonas sp. RZ5]TEW51686.1 cytidine deaminase [Psychromonas sp. RZ5]
MSFKQLTELAQSKLRAKQTSGFISCGQVSAAIETVDGNQYVGVCIDTPSSLGICAERNAAGNMITEGEFQIVKLVALKGEKTVLPCGVCREFLLQLHPENGEIEILQNIDGTTIKLKQLMPQWRE